MRIIHLSKLASISLVHNGLDVVTKIGRLNNFSPENKKIIPHDFAACAKVFKTKHNKKNQKIKVFLQNQEIIKIAIAIWIVYNVEEVVCAGNPVDDS